MKLFLSLLLIYVGLVGVMVVFQRHLLYVPATQKLSPPADIEILVTATQDGLELTHWLRRASQPARAVIVYFHGNGGHMRDRILSFPMLQQNGFDLLITGYRGYSGNEGSPSEQGLYTDSASVMAWARQHYDHIILFGESLGTGVAVEMAAKDDGKIKAVILESPYTSIPDMVRVHYPFVPFANFLLRDQFRTRDKVGALTMPVLVVVAGNDTIIPVANSRKVYEMIGSKKSWKLYEEATHVGLLPFGLEKDVLEFIAEVKL